MDAPRFTARFTANAHVYTPPTATTDGEALASLDQLRALLPPEIVPEQDTDIVYIVGNLAVGGLLNGNDDGVTTTDMLSIYPKFERRQCNIEHNRGQIVGYILKAGLSEFGSNKLLTADEARASGKPFNIVTVAALWKVANRDLCSFILGTVAPGSPDADALSLSFEVGFNDYSICVLPKGIDNLSQASKIIPSDSPDFDNYNKLLRINKGSGKIGKDGSKVGRILGGDLTPLGQGVVTVPAAAVKGISPIISSPEKEEPVEEACEGEAASKQEPNSVYTLSHMTLSTANRVKIPAGLAAKIKNDKQLPWPKATVTLSDGRVLKDVTIFNGEELELDKSISLDGVVITDMTPQWPPQADDTPEVHPNIDKVYPTQSQEKQADNQEELDKKHIAQNLPYTDALLKHIEAAARILHIIRDESSVSPITTTASNSTPSLTPTMDLKDLKNIETKIKSATNVAEAVEAFASVSPLVEEIMKASVKFSQEATQAANDKQAAEASIITMKAELAEARRVLNELQAAQALASAEAKFQERMASIAEAFDLDDEVRAYVVEEVKACADDASFEKYFSKAKKVMKEKMKKNKSKDQDKDDGKDDGKDKGKVAKATSEDADSQETKHEGSSKDLKSKMNGNETVDSSDTTPEDSITIVNAAAAALASAKENPVDNNIDQIGDVTSAGQSIADKMKAAFGGDNTSIGGRKIKDIVSSDKK